MVKRRLLVSGKCLRAREKAIRLMAQHGLIGWQFRFGSSRRRAAACFYPAGHLPGKIELSVHFIERNDEARVDDTILHEIAHALAGQESGDRGHGEAWRAACVRIGAKPNRCYVADEVDMPRGRWQAQCPGCKREFHRHRKPKHMDTQYCVPCGPDKGSFTWRDSRA